MHSSQIRTILWLRWRLTVNQLRKGGSLNAVLAAVLGGVILAMAVSAAAAGLWLGVAVLVRDRPLELLALYDVLVAFFVLLWMISIVSDIQRSETISLAQLLHLPVSLKGVFAVNYLASHLALSIILLVPAMLGLALGLTIHRGLIMLWLIPLVLAVVFAVTAWTYCLRGWLVSLMVNPRRRRAVIAYVTMGFVLLTQLPNLLLHFGHNSQGQRQEVAPAVSPQQRPGLPRTIIIVHQVLPLGWIGYGAMGVAAGNALPAVLGTAGGLVIGVLGLARAYRSTLRFYHGQYGGRQDQRVAKQAKAESPALDLVERRLPGIPQEATNLAQVFFRSLIRAPEIRMALLTNTIILLVACAGLITGRSGHASEARAPFIAAGAVSVSFLAVLQLMFNLFGHDRGGFRCLVLSPLSRHMILLAKNLALLPLVLGSSLVILAVTAVLARIALLTVLSSVLQSLAAFLLLSTIGNALSCLVPYRVAPGSLKPTKMRTATAIIMGLSRLLLIPVAMVPLFLGPALGWWLGSGPASARWVNLSASAAAAVLFGLGYGASLRPLGRLLARREKQILDVVTQQVE